MTPPPNVVYLADHSVLLAIPAVLPALVIVGVVLFVVLRDRRAERDDAERNANGESIDSTDTDERNDQR